MAHEDLNRTIAVEGSSNRTFGLVFSGMFLVVACWPLFARQSPRLWALIVAMAFAVVAILKPALLDGLNRLWTKLGLMLGKIVSPIALGILFYCMFTPMALWVRLTQKDPLRLNFDSDADSYWIPREPPGPPPNSMKKQF